MLFIEIDAFLLLCTVKLVSHVMIYVFVFVVLFCFIFIQFENLLLSRLLPPFGELKSEHVVPGMKELLAEAHSRVEELEKKIESELEAGIRM